MTLGSARRRELERPSWSLGDPPQKPSGRFFLRPWPGSGSLGPGLLEVASMDKVDWKSWAIRLGFTIAGAIVEALTNVLHSLTT